MTNDLRQPPLTAGYAALGEMLVPQRMVDEQWLQAASDWHGLDDTSRADRVSEAFNGGWRSEFDSPYNNQRDYEQLGIVGAYNLALNEWIWPDRFAILQRCHMAWERNPLANTAVGLTTLFVVGKGLQRTYYDESVKQIVEDFWNDPENDCIGAETEFIDGLQVDGELFIHFFTADGITKIVDIKPWEIIWITADINFRKRIISYRQQSTYRQASSGGPGDTETVIEDWPAEEIQHVKINCLRYETRGRPELWRILPWLKAYKDWLEERSRLNRRKSIYYHMKLSNATPAQVQATRSAYREPPPPASFLVTNDQVDIQPVAQDIRAGEASEDGRALKLMNVAGKKLPEYMMGEGAHSTKATASTQELPALVNFEYFQGIAETRLWKPIIKRVIQNAVDAGLIEPKVKKTNLATGKPILDAMKQEQWIDAIEAFDAKYADVTEPDPYNLAQALQIYQGMGILSKETIAQKGGFDYSVEGVKIEDEQTADMAALYNRPPMPGMTGLPVQSNSTGTTGAAPTGEHQATLGAAEQPPSAGYTQPATVTTQESVVNVLEYNDNHDASNGQFANGGGSGGGKFASGTKDKSAVYQRGFSAKYAEQVSKEGLKPHKGAIYASTAEDVAHRYGVEQALGKDHINQYAIVSFRSDKGAAVYPNSPKSKKSDYVMMRTDTFYQFDKTIPPSQIVSVNVYEVDPKNYKGKPKLVKQYKESAQGDLLYAAAIVNDDGEMEYLKPPEDKGD